MPKIADEARTARRDQIIAAAAECFARAGYHTTTMADVAMAAGVSKGTPYLYFPGKEALFIALYEEWDCGLAARVDAAVGGLAEPARRSPRTVLAAVASAIAAHVTGNPQTCRVLMEANTLAAYEPAIAAKVQAANAASLDQLTGLFKAGIAAGQWPADTDPALLARLFTAGAYGLMSQWHLAPGSFSLEAAMDAVAATAGAGPGNHRGDALMKGDGT
ncbi:MAG TPA: TetR/AcrR family transcriptional regulator [Streptosporangiaceae bacterium]|nr:TetR/AcrR family transcriptional regulator [Streptosporangiaceae bacterium]